MRRKGACYKHVGSPSPEVNVLTFRSLSGAWTCLVGLPRALGKFLYSRNLTLQPLWFLSVVKSTLNPGVGQNSYPWDKWLLAQKNVQSPSCQLLSLTFQRMESTGRQFLNLVHLVPAPWWRDLLVEFLCLPSLFIIMKEQSPAALDHPFRPFPSSLWNRTSVFHTQWISRPSEPSPMM